MARVVFNDNHAELFLDTRLSFMSQKQAHRVLSLFQSKMTVLLAVDQSVPEATESATAASTVHSSWGSEIEGYENSWEDADNCFDSVAAVRGRDAQRTLATRVTSGELAKEFHTDLVRINTTATAWPGDEDLELGSGPSKEISSSTKPSCAL